MTTPILRQLIELYRAHGITVTTGLNPARFGWPHALFTHFFKDGQNITEGLGISALEVHILADIMQSLNPKSAFVIGNSQGWSTLAMALSSPQCRILAIDAGFDRASLDGLALTEKLAANAGAQVSAKRGISPADVPTLLQNFGHAPELIFIDGYHSNEQVVADYTATRPHAAADAVYILHDVWTCGLEPGMKKIRELGGFDGGLLNASCSGIAILYPRARAAVMDPLLRAYSIDGVANDQLHRIAWRHRHPKLWRWQRRWNRWTGKRA